MADSAGFFFNVEKFFGSMSAQRMSFAEKGVYLVMLFQQYRDAQRSLPDDAAAVAELIAVTPAQVVEIEAAWNVVRRKFVTADSTPGRIFNVAIEQTRREQRAYFKRRSESGRTGGKASAAKRKPVKELVVNDRQAPLNDRSTTVKHRSSTAQRSSSDLIRREEIGLDQIGREGIVPVARSKRPIFSGQRLTVFEWMLDDCVKTLGPLTDAFDLHEWFFSLDSAASTSGMVIPQRDGGSWLQAQLVAEAQRRGLAIAVAGAAFGKQTSRLQSALANIKAEAS